MRQKTKQLGQILIEQGLISEDQLREALQVQERVPKSLGRILIDLHLIKETDLVRALAHQIGLEFVDLGDYPIDPMATALIPESVAHRYRALPIGERDGRLLVAMSDPANVYALDDIRTITGREVEPVVATSTDVTAAIRKYSEVGSEVEALATEASALAEDSIDLNVAEAAVEDAPVVKLVHQLLSRAVNERASDVHIEPAE
ncbi:MAG TPA: type II secretion system protein GspE, partial [Actinomycetota bacterium]|nr:type II secretion system protein GspE [Actinomycetota bacterium]